MRTVHVLRKPVAGTSVAESVLTYGAGALNVDGTRVSVAGGEPDSGANYYRNRGLPMPSNRQSYFGQDKGSVVTSVPMPNGRWPANLILQHLEGCRQDGEKQVVPPNGSGRTGSGANGFRTSYVGGARSKSGFVGSYVAEDGTETVAAWVCTPECPVAALDQQSGVLKSGVAVRHRGVNSGGYGGNLGLLPPGTPDSGFADAGGASRFFKQFQAKLTGGSKA